MTDTTFGLVARFRLLEGQEDAFDALVAETVTAIRANEHDTLAYVTHLEEGAPQARVFYELYRDRAAFDSHENSDHVRRFLAEREAHLTGPPEVWRVLAREGILRDLPPDPSG